MDTEFGSFVRSHMFTFFIGKEKVPITVHAAAIASLSPALNGLIYGPMSESNQKAATFDDVDPDTFVLFCQFAYVRDYIPPKAVAVSGLSEPKPTRTPYKSRFINWIGGSNSDDEGDGKEETEKDAIEARLNDRFDLLSRRSVHDVSRYKPKCDWGYHMSYAPVFMGHTRLYILADKWGVDELKSLCLGKLHGTLASFSPFGIPVHDVLEIVRFIYADETTTSCDNLRVILVRYIASTCKNYCNYEEFVNLLSEGGDFVADFWKEVNMFVTGWRI